MIKRANKILSHDRGGEESIFFDILNVPLGMTVDDE